MWICRRYFILMPALLLFFLACLTACSDENPTSTGEQPQGLVLYPQDGAVLTADFVVNIGLDAVDSMAVFLDDSLLAVVTEAPFALPVMLVDHGPGERSLAVTVYEGDLQENLTSHILLCHGIGRDVGNFAPSYTLTDLNGIKRDLRTSLRGKVLLLDFWATWCPPCIYSLPETQRLYEKFGDKGLDVLTIADDIEDVVRDFVDRNDYSFPVMMDPNGMAHKVFGVWAIPTYYLIDHRGVVRYVYVGTGGTPLEELILELL